MTLSRQEILIEDDQPSKKKMAAPRRGREGATSPLLPILFAALFLAAAAAALPAARAAAIPFPAAGFPPLVPAGDRDPSAAAACACVDGSIGSDECAKGVASYCEGKAGEAGALCEAAGRFFSQRSIDDGPAVAKILSAACAVDVPERANACACLQVGCGWLASRPLTLRGGGRGKKGETTAAITLTKTHTHTNTLLTHTHYTHSSHTTTPTPQDKDSPGCKAATLNTCMRGNTMCPALAFGPSAVPDSLQNYAKFATNYCPFLPISGGARSGGGGGGDDDVCVA